MTDMRAALEALKPCPFCGSKAVVTHREDAAGKWYCFNIHCENGDCYCFVDMRAQSAEKAVEQWNRRARSALSGGEGERIAGLREALATCNQNAWLTAGHCAHAIRARISELERSALSGPVGEGEAVKVTEKDQAVREAFRRIENHPCRIDGIHHYVNFLNFYRAALSSVPAAMGGETREALKPFAEIMDEVERCLEAGISGPEGGHPPWEHIHRRVLPIKEEALIQINIAHLRKARDLFRALTAREKSNG